jgi:urease gamma subunit
MGFISSKVYADTVISDVTATANSYVSPYSPDRAVNTITDSTKSLESSRWYCTDPNQKWLQLDLKKSYYIDKWHVENLGSLSWDPSCNTKDYELLASDNGLNWTNIQAISNNIDNTTTNIVKPFTAKYVKLNITQGNQNNNLWASIVNFQVSATNPLISSCKVPSNNTYVAGQNLDFTVSFSADVEVNTMGGTPYIPVTIGSKTVNAQYVSGTGTETLIFRYTVQSGDLAPSGISVGTSIESNGGIIKDYVGNTANLALNSVGDTTGVKVDSIAPGLIVGQVNRTSDTTAEVKFTSDEAGQYYYEVVESGAVAPTLNTSGIGMVCAASENTIDLTGLTSGEKDIYIKVKDAAGNVSNALKINISIYVPPTYTIASIENIVMSDMKEGYSPGSQETKTITIIKTGTGNLANLSVSLSGGLGSNFEITQPTATILNSVTTSADFTVKAKDGLGAGTYAETVTVSADSMTSVTFTVQQVINEAMHGKLSFTSAADTVNENVATKTLTVNRSGGSDGVATVDYIVSGTATGGGMDYTLTTGSSSGILTFEDGQTSQTITITINNDAIHEVDETIEIILSNPTGGISLGTNNKITLTIVDDDAIPVLSNVATSVETPNTLAATSSQNGTIYLVLKAVKITDKARLEAQVTANKAKKVTATANTLAEIPTTGLTAGTYVVYAVDEAGNVSEKSGDVTITNPDNTKPVITLLGSASVTVENGAAYTDEGVTITDNKDTGLTATVTYKKDGASVSSINTSIAGTYTIHYNVSDEAGNKADEVTRIVVVLPVKEIIEVKIGSTTTNYTSLEDAFNAVPDNSTATIKLLSDVDLSNKIISIDRGETINLDLDGKNIIAKSNVFINNGTLKLTDNSTGVAGKISSSVNGYVIVNSGILTMDKITISGNSIVVGGFSDSTFTMNGGSISSVYSEAINLLGSTFTMNGGTIYGKNYGFEEYVNSSKNINESTLNLNDGTVKGGIYAIAKSIDGSPISASSDYILGVNSTIEVNTDTEVTVKASKQTGDTIKPIVILKGNSSETVENGATYTDAGVTITDNKDTGLIATVTYTKDAASVSSINTTIAGTYTIHYNVSDAAGNVAIEVTRTVIVKEQVTPPAQQVTLAPTEENIMITNNVEGTQDVIEVKALNAGDIVKVYNASTGGSLIGIGTAATGQTSALINVSQLGKDAGNIYVSITSSGKTESLRTQKAYAAEIRNSSISTSAITFDKNVSNQADVNVNIDFNGNTLIGINNRSYTLVNDTDYVVNGNIVTIKKNYLLNQSFRSFVITFNFSGGNAQSMTVTIVDSTTPPVVEKLSIDKQNPKDATVGEAYSYTFTAAGGTGIKTYAVTIGNLPEGLILSPNGVLSGVTTSSAINVFTVEVTDSALPANKDSYSFVIKVLNKISAALKNLKISTGSLNESFSEITNSYTASVAHGVSSIKVTPTTKDNTASVKVNGVTVLSEQESQDISLNVGLNKITVEVTATDGTKNEYIIHVTRAKKSSDSSGGSSSTGGSNSSQGTGSSGTSNGSNASGNLTTNPADTQTNNGARVINNAKEYGVVGETVEGKEIVQSVNKDKQIEIAFNDVLKESTLTNNNVYVLDSKGNKVEVTVKYDAENKKLIVTPVKDYIVGEKYTLYIKDIVSADDKKLQEAVKYSFEIETGSQQSKPEVNEPKEDNKKPEVSQETVEAKVAEAKLSKKFGTYNEAYAMIISLPEEKQAYYFNELNEIAKEVYTELNKKILGEIKTFVSDANLKSYEDMLAEINNKVEDPIDKGYFLGELTSWGKQLVYTKDVLEAVDKIIKAYTEKTAEAIYKAEKAIEKIDNAKTKEYLREELKKAASKVDSLNIVYFK